MHFRDRKNWQGRHINYWRRKLTTYDMSKVTFFSYFFIQFLTCLPFCRVEPSITDKNVINFFSAKFRFLDCTVVNLMFQFQGNHLYYCHILPIMIHKVQMFCLFDFQVESFFLHFSVRKRRRSALSDSSSDDFDRTKLWKISYDSDPCSGSDAMSDCTAATVLMSLSGGGPSPLKLAAAPPPPHHTQFSHRGPVFEHLQSDSTSKKIKSSFFILASLHLAVSCTGKTGQNSRNRNLINRHNFAGLS